MSQKKKRKKEHRKQVRQEREKAKVINSKPLNKDGHSSII